MAERKAAFQKKRERVRRALRAVFDRIQGMNVAIHKKDVPSFVPTHIRNVESTQQFGVGRKRPLYKNILTTGITALKGMFEFVDKNDVRSLVVQDGTAIKNSVYSGGYGAIASITTDKRAGSPTVDQMFPVEWKKSIRSGAGLNATTDLPFWIGHIKAKGRFLDAVTIAAGKYLDIQSYDNNYSVAPYLQSLKPSTVTYSLGTGKVADVGLDKGFY